MQYSKLKSKGFVVLTSLAISLAACNSNRSSNTVADTTAATTQSLSDTMQEQAVVPPETPPEEAAPVTSSQSKTQSAPVTSSQSETQSAPQPSNSATSTKEVIIKKKVEVIVEAPPVAKYPKVKMDKSGVYEYSEISPEYPGGPAAIERYINNHINYPQHALNNNIQGKVNVSFVVNEYGQVNGAHIIGKGLGNGLNEEAVRVVSSLPNWKPGTVKGKPIKTKMTLPITFRIES